MAPPPGTQFGQTTWTGYNIQTNLWNLEILKEALAYLVGYKDTPGPRVRRRGGQKWLRQTSDTSSARSSTNTQGWEPEVNKKAPKGRGSTLEHLGSVGRFGFNILDFGVVYYILLYNAAYSGSRRGF
ncbi:G2/mitotic-specific cyclin [Hypoxylon texense]